MKEKKKIAQKNSNKKKFNSRKSSKFKYFLCYEDIKLMY